MNNETTDNKTTNNDRVALILDEWFGQPGDDGKPTAATRERWFKKDPAFDAHLRANYSDDVRRALAGDYDDWTETARGALALVILLDQMTRNIFRDSAEMYCGDDRTVACTLEAIESGLDTVLSLPERQFFYMPLMHAEDVALQDRCLEVFQRLVDEGGADVMGYARSHRDIVARFGRFPHRNALLSRASTAEELAFLTQPGSSF